MAFRATVLSVMVGLSIICPRLVGAVLYGTVPGATDTTLITIDPSSGVVTLVGSIGFPDVQGLAGRATDGKLFAATAHQGSASAGQVLTIAPLVSSTGSVLGVPDGRPIGALALSPTTGVLYATCNRISLSGQPDALCTVNQLTGTLTPVVPDQALDPAFIIGNFNGLTFNAAGMLYASTSKVLNPPSEPRLYTVNTVSGIATAIGMIRDGSQQQFNGGVVGLAFVGGVLYGATDTGRIITIDPATAVYADVGPTGLGIVQDLTDLSVPTPQPTATPTGPMPTPTAGPCSQSPPNNPCVPGGGPAKTDCQLEWLANPVPLLENQTPVPDVVCQNH